VSNIIGPHFFEKSLNGKVYTDFLENILSQLLENIPLDLRINMWQHTWSISSFCKDFST